MKFLSPTIRLAMVLALLTVNLVFFARFLGFFPDEAKIDIEYRKKFVEALAVQLCSAAEMDEFRIMQATLRAVVTRDDDILSAAVRTLDGKLIAVAGEHLAYFRPAPDSKLTPASMQVSLFRNGKKWGSLEICFVPLWKDTLDRGLINSFAGLLFFLGLFGFLSYFFVIRKTLRELDPSKVIPGRVQKAFDILQEGVILLDADEYIVMANNSFAELFGKTPESIIGLKGSEFGWLECPDPSMTGKLPWFMLMNGKDDTVGAPLSVIDGNGSKIKFMVRAVRVGDDAGNYRGCLVTFDNITEIEEKNFLLNELVEKLRQTNDEINAKTRELEVLASCDPMTLCLNRRSMGIKLDELFTAAQSSGEPLSCLMLDIDFFKSVNDRYGHATGDQVIKAIADVLKVSTRESDPVGRYGGEEFCVALPEMDLENAAQVGERIRRTVESKSISGVKVTISVGVATLDSNVNKPDELVNQADMALYAAKEGGRNRVVTWGEDIEVAATTSDGAESGKQDNETGQPELRDDDPDKLRQRVQELEALLAKRNIELKHYEIYDLKTGLPTLSLFEDRINHEIARSRRNACLCAVITMNIDTVKRIQETHGMKASEKLLNACAQRLNSALRKDVDTIAVIENFHGETTISLVSNTEFGILLTAIKQVDHITWVIKRIRDSFEEPFIVNRHEVYVSVYLGVSIFPHDGQTVDELCSGSANACSYAQKEQVNQRYMFASRKLNEKAVSQLKIENLLYEVVANNDLQLYYQPIIQASTGHAARFEALLRWHNSELGWVPPDKFIPIAEQTGQIDEIGNWVIYNACRQLRTWLDMGLDTRTVAVNISVLQLHQANLATRIREILKEFDLPPHMLEIELTESSFLNIEDQTFSVMKHILDIGIRLSMDDFGTGYSSLAYLNKIPLSAIKIDRTFMADLNINQGANELVASIISMSHGLKLEVVAEGVEEKYQADYLIAHGCDYLQGYYFSKPVPASDVPDILENNRTLP